MVKELTWDSEYSYIKEGDAVIWKDFIYECIEKVEYRPRKEALYMIVEDLKETDFFDCPASTRYHHAYKHGLIKHTCETIALAFLFRNACGAEIDHTELFTCSLLHDYGKVGKYDVIKDEGGNISAFKYIDRGVELSDQLRSVVYAAQMLPDLSDQEVFAILYHDGLYPDENNRSKNKETPLQLMIHWADMWSARMDQYGW